MRIRLPFRRGRDEQGAAMVEFAILAPALILMVIGMLEFGLIFRDSLTANSASREAARVISAVGRDPNADNFGLDAAKATLDAARVDIESIVIINQDNEGARYELDAGGNWMPPTLINGGWDPGSRQTDIQNLDHVIVVVNYNHEWVTGLFGNGQRVLNEETEMRLEPRQF